MFQHGQLRLCAKCRRGEKWPSAVVLYVGTSLHLPRKQKYNFIIPFCCKGRGYIVTVKRQCPLKEHLFVKLESLRSSQCWQPGVPAYAEEIREQ